MFMIYFYYNITVSPSIPGRYPSQFVVNRSQISNITVHLDTMERVNLTTDLRHVP